MDSVVLAVALARHQNRESMTHAKTFRQMPSKHTVAKYSIPGQVLNIHRHIVCRLEVTKYIGKICSIKGNGAAMGKPGTLIKNNIAR